MRAAGAIRIDLTTHYLAGAPQNPFQPAAYHQSVNSCKYRLGVASIENKQAIFYRIIHTI